MYYLIAILYVLHMLYILNFFCDKHPSKFRKGCWCKEAERIRMVEENFHKINSWRVDYINDLKLTFDAEKWFNSWLKIEFFYSLICSDK